MLWMKTHSMIEICCPFMGMVVKNKTLEKTEGVIKNGQSRETGNIGYTRHRTKAKKANKR